jgi:hypothetical protein
VIAAVFTSLSSLFKKNYLWNIALVSYIVGWVLIGSVIVIVLVGYAYGIETLQIQMSSFSLSLVSYILLTIAVISFGMVTGLVINAIRLRIKKLKEMSKKIDVTQKDLQEARTELISASTDDLQNSLILLRADIEKELRILSRKYGLLRDNHQHNFRRLLDSLVGNGVITPELSSSIYAVYRICSQAVHGEQVQKKKAEIARDFGLKIVISLRNKIKQAKNNQQPSEEDGDEDFSL